MFERTGQVFSAVGLCRGFVVTIRRMDSPELALIGRAVQLHLKAVRWTCSRWWVVEGAGRHLWWWWRW